MAASYNDMSVLGTNTLFVARVQAALVAGALTIAGEASSVANHYRRVSLSVQVLNAPVSWAAIFAQGVATDSSVIADSTAAGTVVLTAANVAAQQALVTDTHIINALNAQFSSYVSPF